MFRPTIPALVLLGLTLAFGSPARAARAEQTGPAAAKVHETPAEKNERESVKAVEAGEPGHEGASAARGEKIDIMKVESPLAIWTLVVFVGLMLVLGRFAWKPLLKALQEREAHLEHVLLDSERARNEAEALAAQNRRELAQAADQVRALIEQARKDALVAADSIIRKAQADAEAARERAEREIGNARDQALMDIWSKTADLAVSVAGRVLSKEMGESDHRRLVEVAMSELPANGHPDGART